MTFEQPGVVWRKATLSGVNGNCVEVAKLDNRVLVRHSQQPLGPFLSFSGEEWEAFLAGVKAHEFDLVALPLGSKAS